MTWTCTQCDRCNVNPDDAPKCLSCGADEKWGIGSDKPSGLSEEDRAAWEAYCSAYSDQPAARAVPRNEETPESRRFAVNVYRAARAPLEAEVKTLRERVRELEEHSKYQHTRLGEADRAAEEAEKSAEFWKDFHDMEKEKHHAWVRWARENGAVATGPNAERDARRMLEAQLAQAQKPAAPGAPVTDAEVSLNAALCWCRDFAGWLTSNPQARAKDVFDRVDLRDFVRHFPVIARELERKREAKPAAPAGLPEVAEEIEVSVDQKNWHKGTVRFMADIRADVLMSEGPWAGSVLCVLLRGPGWRRLPPAQTSYHVTPGGSTIVHFTESRREPAQTSQEPAAPKGDTCERLKAAAKEYEQFIPKVIEERDKAVKILRGEPAASPPGEVSTAKLTRERDELLNLCRGFAWCHPARHEEFVMQARALIAKIEGGK